MLPARSAFNTSRGFLAAVALPRLAREPGRLERRGSGSALCLVLVGLRFLFLTVASHLSLCHITLPSSAATTRTSQRSDFAYCDLKLASEPFEIGKHGGDELLSARIL